jgi:outer membrane lipoprotein SlyB
MASETQKEEVMNAGFVRRAAAFAAMGVVLLGTGVSALAQTSRTTRPKVVTNDPATYRYAHQHGYRAGYEDGFTKGKSDYNENQAREFENSEAFGRADRGYEARMGTLAEFQEAYRVGFELGYNDGYYGRPFTVSIPSNLGRLVIATVNANNAPPPVAAPGQAPVAATTRPRSTDASPARAAEDRQEDRRSSRAQVTVPDGVQMKIRLTSQISTKTNKEGDKFTAIVLDPSDYADAVVEGHIAKLNRSGRATGKTEMSLVFDSIRTRDGRSGRFTAQVDKVYESETVKTVDEEGNVQTGSRTKDTATRTAGGAALGAIIGGIAGGGKGAAIGAAIGAGVGVGSVFVQDGKDLILDPGTEMLIRSASPARTRD